MRVDDQGQATAALPPGKGLVLTVQEAGWAPEPVWMYAENLASTRIPSPQSSPFTYILPNFLWFCSYNWNGSGVHKCRAPGRRGN